MSWQFKHQKIPKIDGAIMLVGLPGIGNVGKIVVDFLADELKAKSIARLFSHHMPHSVFVTEDNLIELPKIELFHKKIKDNDFLFLTGDTQPVDEEGTYSLCETILDFFVDHHGSDIITLGGIGLSDEPKLPKVYLTGTTADAVKRYKKGTRLKTDIYGVVGPIMGVSGLMLGLAGKRKMPAVSLLAETLGHPMYLGLKGSREILKVLNKKFSLGVDLKKLNKEIDEIEKKIKLAEDLGKTSKKKSKDINYIG